MCWETKITPSASRAKRFGLEAPVGPCLSQLHARREESGGGGENPSQISLQIVFLSQFNPVGVLLLWKDIFGER